MLSSRVRALHSFEPTDSGELGFEKGDVIKVTDRLYKEWWKGQLRGKTGIFPLNYVEPIPEPTPEEITREAQQEAHIFSQAAAIDQLLEMLKKVDPVKDNLADNEEIQELYRSCMTLRPKIVKLIDRYSQKRADLLNMNDGFVRAKKIFDDAMEESLAKYNPGVSLYDYYRVPNQGASPYGIRPPTAYGWNPAVYSGQPIGPGAGYPYEAPMTPQTPLGSPDLPPNQYQVQFSPQVHPQSPPPHTHQNLPVSSLQNGIYPQTPAPVQPLGASGGHPFSQQAQSGPAAYQQHQLLSNVPQQLPQPTKTPVPQSNLPQHSFQPIRQSDSLGLGGAPGGPQQQQAQPMYGGGPQQQQPPQPTQQLASPVQPQQAEPLQSQAGDEPSPIDGNPPFPFDANRRYADPNVQAWARYYASGGIEPAGRAYFIPSTLPLANVGGTDSPLANAQRQRQASDPQQVQPQQQQNQQYQQGPYRDPSFGGPASTQQYVEPNAQDSNRGGIPVREQGTVPIITTTPADDYRGGSPSTASPRRSGSLEYGVSPASPVHSRNSSLPLGGRRGPLPDVGLDQGFKQLSMNESSQGPPEAIMQ